MTVITLKTVLNTIQSISESTKLKAIANGNFHVIKIILSCWIEHILGKGGNAGYQYFYLFPQRFQKASSSGQLNLFLCVNPLPNNLFLAWSKLKAFKAFADDKTNVASKQKFFIWIGRKHCGKRRKCWLPAFSPFLTMFSKGYFLMVVKCQDCVIKSLRKEMTNVFETKQLSGGMS